MPASILTERYDEIDPSMPDPLRHRLSRMRLHHARAQPQPAAARARRSSASYASRDAAKAEAFRREFGGVGELRRLRGRDRRSAHRRGRRRRAAALSSRPDAAGARRRQARAGREAGVSAHGGLSRRSRPRATRPARVVLVGENDHYKPLAVTLRRLLARDAIGEMVFAHFTTIAQRLKSAGRLAQRRSDGRRRRVLRGRHPLAAPRRQPRPADRAGSIHGFRPAAARGGVAGDRRAKSMMVAFRYDNGAVGSLYYSREIPSLFKGLRLSKLFGRDGIITFESNGAVRRRRAARAFRGRSSRASATSAATRRCIAISPRRPRTAARPR